MDSTPWLVGGGAEHSAETARLLAYVASGGREGVAEPGDFKVTPLAVPGGGVRVAPGGVMIRNTYPGGGQQMYVARNASTQTVDVGATTSAGGRADLVVARVLDPQYEGTPPADPTAFNYARLEVVRGVPAGAKTAADAGLSYPAVALARINLPASTGTVQTSHITDLRALANPRAERYVDVYNVLSRDDTGQTSAYVTVGPEISFPVPEWATRAKFHVTVGGFHLRNGTSTGLISGLSMGQSLQQTNWSIENTDKNYERATMVVTGDLTVSAARRGTTQTFRLRTTNNTAGTYAGVNSGAAITLDIQFEEDRA